VGEKVPKADEGAFDCRVNVAGRDGFSIGLRPQKNVFVPSCNAPLIRLRHLLPPQKARGAKALDWKELNQGVRNAG
jgi:hypothetical protein